MRWKPHCKSTFVSGTKTGSPWDRWVEEYEAARAAFARFIGAAPEEVAVITSASAGINSVASALDFGKRRKVVMGEFEFPDDGANLARSGAPWR